MVPHKLCFEGNLNALLAFPSNILANYFNHMLQAGKAPIKGFKYLVQTSPSYT